VSPPEYFYISRGNTITMTEDHSHHLEQDRQNIIRNIENYGCHLVLIEQDHLPAFVYSIGLFQNFGHAEIICIGLKKELMSALINGARDLIKQGETLTPGKPYNGFLQGYSIQFIEVDKDYYGNYVGYAGWFYNYKDFPLLQLVWPDKEHNFPWDENFNPNIKFQQPLLDRNTDFKFYEERNLGVYTTRQAFEGDPILYVYHNTGGVMSAFCVAMEFKMLFCFITLSRILPHQKRCFSPNNSES
jgi:hypothetical protein